MPRRHALSRESWTAVSVNVRASCGIARRIPPEHPMSVATQQVVYVLSGDSLPSAARYVSGVSLSILSLRRFHPTAVVVCLCDRPLHEIIVANNHPILRLADRIEVCPDATGGPVHRSRYLKTTLRRHLEGPFLYLDADTLVAGPLDELSRWTADASFTLDRFFPEEPGRFPSWLLPHYQHLGWPPTDRYFNGGFFRVAATPAAARLFDAWHTNWLATVRVGIVSDQPSLNRAIATGDAEIGVLPERFNQTVGRIAFTVSSDTRVLSFLASRRDTMAAAYVGLIERFSACGDVRTEDIAAITSEGVSYARHDLSVVGDLRRRLAERVGRTAARFGLWRASRE